MDEKIVLLTRCVRYISSIDSPSKALVIMTTLERILKNISLSPNEPKFQKIPTKSNTFRNTIADCEYAIDFMCELGFVRTIIEFEEYYVYSCMCETAKLACNGSGILLERALELVQDRIAYCVERNSAVVRRKELEEKNEKEYINKVKLMVIDDQKSRDLKYIK
jgi:hypothetical protein